MKRPITLTALALTAFLFGLTGNNLQAKTIYVAPSGSGNGTDEAHPAGNISNAASNLNPGDTLVFLDGTYHQTLSINGLSGTEQAPVVLMAQNPGEVVINADTVRTHAVYIDNARYLKIDGIEGGNSLHHAWNILHSSYLTLTRCAGFNAGYYQGTDGHAVVTYEDNCHVFSIAYSDHILSEDIWGWGTGRYVFVYFQCSFSTIRRGVFRADNYDRAPHAGLNIYDCNQCIAENVIAFGTRFNPGSDYNIDNDWGLVQGGMVFDDHTFPADPNKILGCFDLDNGQWRTDLPRSNPAVHVMSHWNGEFEDMVIWKNALNYGFVMSTDQDVKLPERALIGGPSKIRQETNPYVNNRYVNGVLTTIPLWPWPNENIIKRDLQMDQTITEYVRGMLSPNLSINDNMADGTVTSLKLDTASVTLLPGDSLRLSYELLPDDALYPHVEWWSEDESIATVNQEGTVKAVSPGRTLIRIKSTDSGLSDGCEVIVEDNSSGVNLNKSGDNLFRVFPNPVKGDLTIECPAGSKTTVNVFDSNGKLIRKIYGNGGSMKMSTSGMTPGIYILSIKSGKSVRKISVSVQ